MNAAWNAIFDRIFVFVGLLIAGEVASGGSRIEGFGE